MRSNATSGLLAAALCLLGAAAFGQDSTNDVVRSLDDCIRIGLARSAAAVNARRDVEVSKAVVGQARSEALPQASVSASYTRLDELEEVSFNGGSQEVGTLDNYEVSATLSQLLYSGGRVGAALRGARSARDMAEWALQEVDTALIRDIRIGFYDILLARRTVEVRRESVAQLRKQAEQIDARFRNGAASEFDALSARVRVSNEEPLLIAARNDYALARERLRRLLGLDEEALEVSGTLEGDVVDVDEHALYELAQVQRPEIHRSRLMSELREEDIRAGRSSALPEVRASLTYYGANSFGFVSFEEDWQWHWNAGVQLAWDVWDGGLTWSTVREKRLEYRKSLTTLQDVRRSVRLDVRTALLELARARESIDAGTGSVRQAEKALAIARTRYEAGLSTYIEFTDSNLALSTARLIRARAWHAYRVAAARLAFACGYGEDHPFE